MATLDALPQDLWREMGDWLYLHEITRLYQAGSQHLNSRLESVLFRQLACRNAGVPNKKQIDSEMMVLSRLSAEEVAVNYSLNETSPFRPSWLRCCAAAAKRSILLARLFYYDVKQPFPTWLELCGSNFERISVEEPWYSSELLNMFSQLPENLQSLEMRDFFVPDIRFPSSLNVLDLALSINSADAFISWSETALSSLPQLHTLRLDLDSIEDSLSINFDLTPYPSLATIVLQICYPSDAHQCWHLKSPYIASVDVRKKRNDRDSYVWGISDRNPLLILYTPNIKELSLKGVPFIPSIWPDAQCEGRKSLQKLTLRHSFVCGAITMNWPPSLVSIRLIDTDVGELRDRSANGQKQFSLNYALLPPHLVELKIERHSHSDSQARMMVDDERFEPRMNRSSSQNENRFSHFTGGGSGPYRMDEESCGYKILPCPKLRLIVLNDEARGAAFFPSALHCLPGSVTYIRAIASSFIYAGSVWTDETLQTAMKGTQTFRNAVLASSPPGTVLEETSPLLAIEKLVRICWERRTSGNPAFQFSNSAKFEESFSALNLNSLIAYSLFERLWSGLTEPQVQAGYSGVEKAINRGRWSSPAWNFSTPIPACVTKLRAHGCFEQDTDGIYVDGGIVISLASTQLEGDKDLSRVPFRCHPHALPYLEKPKDLESCSSSQASSSPKSRSRMETDDESEYNESHAPTPDPHGMSYLFFAIRSIDIWDSIATQIVALDMDRMEKTDVRYLLRKTRGFRLMTALRRVRVQAGCGSSDLSLAQLPEWLEEVVWDAGRTTLGLDSSTSSLPTLFESQSLNVPEDSQEPYFQAIGRVPRLYSDENRKLNLQRLVCRVSAADSLSVEELVKWRLPYLKELQLLPLKTAIADSNLAIDGVSLPSTLLNDLIDHLRILEMCADANLDQTHQPSSLEQLKHIAKKFLERNASSPALRCPSVAFNSVDPHSSPLNASPELNVEAIKDWIKVNLPNTHFDTFSIPDLRSFIIPDTVDTINLVPEDDPFMSLLDDDEIPTHLMDLKIGGPQLSMRRSSDELDFANWPPALTKIQLSSKEVHRGFFDNLPSTLRIIHIFATRKFSSFEDVGSVELHKRFPHLEDLFVPNVELVCPEFLCDVPSSCWRIVCDVYGLEASESADEATTSNVSTLSELEPLIPAHIRVLQLNGRVLRKEFNPNCKKRKDTERLPGIEKQGSSEMFNLSPDNKKRRLHASGETPTAEVVQGCIM